MLGEQLCLSKPSLQATYKNHEKSRKSRKSRVHWVSHRFYRVLPGSHGLTSVHRGAHWFTRVLPGAHWFTRVQNRHLVTPSAVLTTTKKGQIYGKLGKNTKMTIITGSHGYKRDHTGSNGFTRVRRATQVHTRVHIGVHHSASLRAQRGSLPGPASLYYKSTNVCLTVCMSVGFGYPFETHHLELKFQVQTRDDEYRTAKILIG